MLIIAINLALQVYEDTSGLTVGDGVTRTGKVRELIATKILRPLTCLYHRVPSAQFTRITWDCKRLCQPIFFNFVIVTDCLCTPAPFCGAWAWSADNHL